ncbi:unnamed protein product [Hermetia illucens]|uniref:Uncharacterized protein n=1 Tax=Hermetia illucens TaxID=343691 RepID=A0A7R8UDZ2_HERIL|nr:unnamed protein product [Hermetia illucens]
MGDKEKDENERSRRRHNCPCNEAKCGGGGGGKRFPKLTKLQHSILKEHKIKELNRQIDVRRKQIQAIERVFKTCTKRKEINTEKDEVRDQCKDRAKITAEIFTLENQLEFAQGDEAKILLRIRNLCLSGKVPKLKYDCQPQLLPKLPTPEPGENLGVLPKPITTKDVPAIIWDHNSLCREIASAVKPPPDEEQPISEQTKAEIENLKKACAVVKENFFRTICSNPPPTKEPPPRKNDPGGKAQEEENEEEGKKDPNEEDNSKLLALLEILQAEVATAKAHTQAGRRKIIELCILLKEKEAAIQECSQLLCRIMESQDTGGSVLSGWLNVKLSRYVEYLRWLLIRLNYEKRAQEAEIKSLLASLAQQDMTLKECLATKKRVCDEKSAEVQEFAAYGVCNISI